jgi:pantothenate kinase
MPDVLTCMEQAVTRIQEIANNSPARVIIGITGKPGSGKTSFTSQLLEKLPKNFAAVVPMDGFHLSNKQLKILGLSDVKGAPNTFDISGYIGLLKRIKSDLSKSIYFPIFYREIEESFAADGTIPASTKVILTEGNYLLLNSGGWEVVATMLDEVWYVNIDDDLRLDRLTKRHQKYGKDADAAYAWARGTDEVNAKIVETTASKADYIINL